MKRRIDEEKAFPPQPFPNGILPFLWATQENFAFLCGA
jgi:hypothetical protein